MTDPTPDEGFAICESCGVHLKPGDPMVYAARSRVGKPPIYWHKDCFEKYAKPFEGWLKPAPKPKQRLP